MYHIEEERPAFLLDMIHESVFINDLKC